MDKNVDLKFTLMQEGKGMGSFVLPTLLYVGDCRSSGKPVRKGVGDIYETSPLFYEILFMMLDPLFQARRTIGKVSNPSSCWYLDHEFFELLTAQFNLKLRPFSTVCGNMKKPEIAKPQVRTVWCKRHRFHTSIVQKLNCTFFSQINFFFLSKKKSFRREMIFLPSST